MVNKVVSKTNEKLIFKNEKVKDRIKFTANFVFMLSFLLLVTLIYLVLTADSKKKSSYETFDFVNLEWDSNGKFDSSAGDSGKTTIAVIPESQQLNIVAQNSAYVSV